MAVGLTIDHKIIRNTNDKVSEYFTSVKLYQNSRDKTENNEEIIMPFNSQPNKELTWEVMLRQTSDWEGTLWGKQDWADRPDKDSSQ